METTIKKIWRLGILSLVAFNLLLSVSPTAPNEPTFTSIDVPGAIFTVGRAINPNGDIVGWYLDASETGHGFLLSQGVFTTIDVPGAVFTAAVGMNPAGEVVGEYDDAIGVGHGFLLSQGSFTTIDPPGATFTVARSITHKLLTCPTNPTNPRCVTLKGTTHPSPSMEVFHQHEVAACLVEL